MCLGIPMELLECQEWIGLAEVDGVQREVSLMLLPEEVEPGDYVLVHAGYALAKIDAEEAAATLELLRQAAEGELLTWGEDPS